MHAKEVCVFLCLAPEVKSRTLHRPFHRFTVHASLVSTLGTCDVNGASDKIPQSSTQPSSVTELPRQEVNMEAATLSHRSVSPSSL